MKIAVLAGDGIGPEVMQEGVRVLKSIGEVFEHSWEFSEADVGGAAFDKTWSHLPDETLEVCRSSDAILFGAVGGPITESDDPKWKDCEKNSILGLRKAFDFHINYRPAQVYPALIPKCILKPELVKQGVDILVVRELSEGIYFGEHHTEGEVGERVAKDVMTYQEKTIEGVARAAFEAAQSRRQKVTSVDKANVLDCSRLWRDCVTRVAKEFPDVELQHMLVDHAAMRLMTHPHDFDVVLTANLFGDILSDQVSVLAGSMGMLPSASRNASGLGLYEPPGGSAPDIAGKNIANPIGMILSVAMMLKYSFGMGKEAQTIVRAIDSVLNHGLRTPDIANGSSHDNVVTTDEIGRMIASHVELIAMEQP